MIVDKRLFFIIFLLAAVVLGVLFLHVIRTDDMIIIGAKESLSLRYTYVDVRTTPSNYLAQCPTVLALIGGQQESIFIFNLTDEEVKPGVISQRKNKMIDEAYKASQK
jgi:hypothetical protein